MRRRPVRSSNLRSVGYDDASETLEIEFRTGSVYRYYGVPRVVYEDLLRAPSLGRYFRYFMANVRDIYRYARAA